MRVALSPSRKSSTGRLARLLALAGVFSVLVLVLAACGDSSSGAGSTSTAGRQANARQGAFSDPKVQACLKKQGVEVPNVRRGNGQPPSGGNGRPPNGGNGQPPSGQAPPNGGSRNSAQAEKLRNALQKCGVTLPNREQSGPPQQQSTTPSETTAG